jgi:2-oxoglutarate dehydrogenase E2 component (dihydrolipoamide succinyltransferase)
MNIVVPEMGESIVDARIARWFKKEGEPVAVGEPLVELETDKIDIEVSAPQNGILQTIAHGEGADVKIGDVLGSVSDAPQTGAVSAKPTEQAAPASLADRSGPSAAAKVAPAPSSAAPTAAVTPAAAAPRAAAAAPANGRNVPATPSARRAARDQNVDLAALAPGGPRVTMADVQNRAGQAPAAKSSAQTAGEPAAAQSARPPASRQAPEVADRREERVRMSKRRATIAKRLVEVQQTAAMLTTFNEVDMTAVMALRERQKDAFKAAFGVGLGVASFFVKAAVVALREFPRLNAEVQGDEMVLKHYYDIGVAVSAAEGLVVPVLRDADRLTFAGIESGIREFAKKAKDGGLTLDDLRGGTFSITNGGVFGSLMSTPILNPPQVGILGLHAIKDRPVGMNGQVVLRPMMYTALTYDHRIVDGAEAVRFLVRVKELIEDPGVLLIGS